MIKKLFMAALLAVFLTAGCAGDPVPGNTPVTPGYPQMQTQEQIDHFEASGCKLFGAYHDPASDAWVFWGTCPEVSTDPCESFMVVPPGQVVPFESCGQGYEGYRILCERSGSCL
ncbi:MAG: hypothetical protein ACYTFK_14780 [Planctomycetota bacterium]